MRADFEVCLISTDEAHNRCIRWDDDFLLAILVAERDGRAAHASNRRSRSRPVGHGCLRYGCVWAVALAGAAHLFGKDVDFQRELRAILLRSRGASNEATLFDIRQSRWHNGDDRSARRKYQLGVSPVTENDLDAIVTDLFNRATETHRLRKNRPC